MAVITARHHHLLLYSSTPEHSEHCSAVLRTLRALLPSLWELASLKFTSSRSKPSLASAPQVWFLQAKWKTFVIHSSLNKKMAIKGLKSFKIFREYNRTRLKLSLSALEKIWRITGGTNYIPKISKLFVTCITFRILITCYRENRPFGRDNKFPRKKHS